MHHQFHGGVGLGFKFVLFPSIDLCPHSLPSQPPSGPTVSGLFSLFAILGGGVSNTKQFLLYHCLLSNKALPSLNLISGSPGSRQNCNMGTLLASTFQHHISSSHQCPSLLLLQKLSPCPLGMLSFHHLQPVPTPVLPCPSCLIKFLNYKSALATSLTEALNKFSSQPFCL